MDLPTMGSLPGISALVQSHEAVILWGGSQARVLYDTDCVIGSAAVDAGNTPSTTLRAGLILGRKTSDGLLYQYNPAATDGTEVPVGVLLNSLPMLGASGSVENKDAGAQGVIIAGPVKTASLTILGTAFTSSAYEWIARRLLDGAFLLDDDKNRMLARCDYACAVQKAADYTVVAADQGKKFIATAAAAFTLPTPEVGLTFEFLQTADANMSIASAGSADDIIVDGDLAADSVTFSTSSHKIGSRARVTCELVGAAPKWTIMNLGGTTMTIA